ncbi:MAG: hypothetical protein CFE25_17690 [Chitinophagaceae bacterium BSSC1]|nr:MAG: hypothetical protein CFE25_17690 [Chitinophagaceae bacterium BSSC1]
MKKRFLSALACCLLIQYGFAQAIPPNTSGRTRSTPTGSSTGGGENVFPSSGFAGIGTQTPGAALEIKKGAGNVRNKNILLKLSNEWASSGQNEPSIMFSNGNVTDPKNVSYWTIGARVSGDNTLKTPQTFKISFKSPTDAVEKEFFSVDSYEGRVKIGDVQTQYDGYKLFVEQGILTEKVKVAVKDSKDWYDNVFDYDYKLMSLKKLEQFIQDNKHLPDMPTTTEVMNDGLDLGKMNGLLLKKVEELTLHMINQQKEIEELKTQVKQLAASSSSKH